MVPFKSSSHSIVTVALSFIISEIKRDIDRKIAIFLHIPTSGAPVRGVSVGILR